MYNIIIFRYSCLTCSCSTTCSCSVTCSSLVTRTSSGGAALCRASATWRVPPSLSQSFPEGVAKGLTKTTRTARERFAIPLDIQYNISHISYII